VEQWFLVSLSADFACVSAAVVSPCSGCVCMREIQKVRFPIFYLNKITYRVTHKAEIQSHVSFTSPHIHQVCLDTYHSDISICQVLHRKKRVLEM
jgi:hypothetical protein